LAASLGKRTFCAAGLVDRAVDWSPHFARTVSLEDIAGSRGAAMADASGSLQVAAEHLAKGLG
jgi:hypothetical protein